MRRAGAEVRTPGTGTGSEAVCSAGRALRYIQKRSHRTCSRTLVGVLANTSLAYCVLLVV